MKTKHLYVTFLNGMANNNWKGVLESQQWILLSFIGKMGHATIEWRTTVMKSDFNRNWLIVHQFQYYFSVAFQKSIDMNIVNEKYIWNPTNFPSIWWIWPKYRSELLSEKPFLFLIQFQCPNLNSFLRLNFIWFNLLLYL